MKALNQTLYDALKRAFKDKIKIANQGAVYHGVVHSTPGDRDSSRIDKKTVITRSGGEEYRVCCPHCGDTRYRLWINHRWGTEMAGMTLDHLAICHNEQCQKNYGFMRWLRSVVEGNVGVVDKEPVFDKDDVGSDMKLEQVPLPGVCTRVDELPDYHVAVRYLREQRGFDPDELGRYWGVSWCEYSSKLPPKNKLIIPIYDYLDGKLVTLNWQARWLEAKGLNDKPSKGDQKYFNMPGVSKNWLLYNAYRAVQNPTVVVICEGVFDVMRFGRTHAVSIFGKTASTKQKELLWQNWGVKGAVGVIALDTDAQKERKDLQDWMSNWSKVITLEYPDGKDAAELPEDYLWGMINKQL